MLPAILPKLPQHLLLNRETAILLPATEISGENGNIFIRILPSKTKVYEGEEVTATVKIYTKLSVESVQVTGCPCLFRVLFGRCNSQQHKEPISSYKRSSEWSNLYGSYLKTKCTFSRTYRKNKIESSYCGMPG